MSDASDKEEIREIPDTPIPDPADSRAAQEAQAILQNDYEEDGKRKDFQRSQILKAVAHWCLIAFVIIGIALVIVLMVVWSWHILAPMCWRWLSNSEIEHIQTLLFSGALSAAITLLGKKVL